MTTGKRDLRWLGVLSLSQLIAGAITVRSGSWLAGLAASVCAGNLAAFVFFRRERNRGIRDLSS